MASQRLRAARARARRQATPQISQMDYVMSVWLAWREIQKTEVVMQRRLADVLERRARQTDRQSRARWN